MPENYKHPHTQDAHQDLEEVVGERLLDGYAARGVHHQQLGDEVLGGVCEREGGMDMTQHSLQGTPRHHKVHCCSEMCCWLPS